MDIRPLAKYYKNRKRMLKRTRDMAKQEKNASSTAHTTLEQVVDVLIHEAHAPAAVVVDAAFDVRLFRGHTALFLEHAPGRPSLQLLSMLRPGLFASIEKLLQDVMHHGEAYTEPLIVQDNDQHALLFVAHTFIHADAASSERFFLIVCMRVPVNTAPVAPTRLADESALASEVERMRQYVGYANNTLQSKEEETGIARADLKKAHEEIGRLRTRLGALEKRAVQLEATLESIGEGVVVVDADAVIEYANPRACTLLQRTREEIRGRPCAEVVELVSGDDEDLEDEHPVHSALSQGTSSEYAETEALSLKLSSGTRMPVRLLATPICEGEVCYGAVLVFHDLTESLRLHQAREEFISYASHQLRTPLSVISLNVELLQRLCGQSGKLSDDMAKSLATIYRASKRMVDLMNVLLSLARLDAGTLQPSYHACKVPDLCKEVKEQLQPLAAEQRMTVDARVSATSVVRTDPQFLHMILQNLLSNAIKYGKPNTRVVCRSRVHNGVLTLSVRDQGIGMSKKDQARIFERHYRAPTAAKTRQEGSGLGLYLVQRMVELLGGSIEVRSKKGTGTTFYVRLPVEAVS